MTILGKILAYVNLTVSVLLAAIAFTLWANRIDLSSPKETVAGDPTSMGLFYQRAKQLGEAWEALPPAEAALHDARTALITEEQKRTTDREGRDGYLAEMQHLKNNVTPLDDPKKAKGGPVQRVQYATEDDPKGKYKKGEVAVDPLTDLPLLKEVKYKDTPLLSMVDGDTKFADILQQRELIEERHKRQAVEAWVRTVMISGPPDRPPPDWLATILAERPRPDWLGAFLKGNLPPKGLIQRLTDERAKGEDMMDEVKRIYPLLVNTKVDAELVLKRNKALKLRVQELQRVGVAAGE